MKLLIDIPEHIYEHAKETTEDSNDEFDAMRAIANGTQQESRSENPNKWIPVSERLPEESKKCLVTFKGGYVGIMCYASDLYRVDEYDFCDKKGKAGWHDYDSEWGYYSRDDVIAWMPLPEPCKVESEVQI